VAGRTIASVPSVTVWLPRRSSGRVPVAAGRTPEAGLQGTVLRAGRSQGPPGVVSAVAAGLDPRGDRVDACPDLRSVGERGAGAALRGAPGDGVVDVEVADERQALLSGPPA